MIYYWTKPGTNIHQAPVIKPNNFPVLHNGVALLYLDIWMVVSQWAAMFVQEPLYYHYWNGGLSWDSEDVFREFFWFFFVLFLRNSCVGLCMWNERRVFWLERISVLFCNRWLRTENVRTLFLRRYREFEVI